LTPILSLAAALLSAALAEFKTDFPGASVVESPSGGRLTHASGFEARGLGNAPETAARRFLDRYAAAFGIGPRQELAVRVAPRKGTSGAVRFERRIGGLPVFDGDVVVGLDAASAVILVNAADVPPQVEGRHRKSRSAAVRSATAGLEISDPPRAQQGWRASGQAIRPVWRVDAVATKPPGSFRAYVDAETGKVLFRIDLRASKTRGPPH
jgi:Zn-dependent metalloprotease